MYRMVKVSPDDFHYQRLLWRKSPAEPIDDYEMRVLMFGLKPAPWLATRTTYELAQREKTSYPNASKIIQEDLYVDELISGGSTPEKVVELRQQVQDMMQSGGFTLRNWVSTNETVSIPRCMILQDFEALELHGFSDASEAAYGAVVNLKSTRARESLIRLITAKTRVAPLSPPQSIPKLELCGALLLANLMEMSLIPNSQWRHVPSEENPADCFSRGIYPTELVNHPLWWAGPKWLSKSILPIQPEIPITTLEERKIHFTTYQDGLNLVDRHSSYQQLLRITAWVIRFVRNLRTPAIDRKLTPLTVVELREAEVILVKRIQRRAKPDEIWSDCGSNFLGANRELRDLSQFLYSKVTQEAVTNQLASEGIR
ncbi:unnamed protein product [Allacma fusca]|uniref:Integrase catalytic domain-containing protein n=2 Tax=Allacma fusca TaxID=39272 RepID=A0A8J2LH76_9HEXA|nr:unnamed protein product [Allacma fusca]